MPPAHRSVANDRYRLWKLGITHVVNAAHGSAHSQGSCDFYGSSVDYYGVPAHDSPSFDLSCYFVPSADYIHRALDGDGGKGLYCRSGTSHDITAWSHSSHNLFFFLLSSPGVGPLCSRGKSLGVTGAGLPRDSPWLHPSAGGLQGQRVQVDLSKQRFPEAASGLGNETATPVMSSQS